MSKREGKKILKDAKAAGRQYAEDQVNGSYFRDWIWNQLWEASRMDPSEVLPIENKQDAKTVALNTLQQLTWDTKSGLDQNEILGMSGVNDDWIRANDISRKDVSDAFYEGFEAELEKKTVINWLTDEILNMEEQLKGHQRAFEQEGGASRRSAIEEARRKPPEMTGGAAEFAELLKSLAHTEGRALFTRIEHRLGGPAHFYERVYVNFINLPEEIVARKAGGGAESENNRMTFWVEGFNGSDPHAPPPSGKVTVETHTSALPREYRLRKKTGPPGAIAHYLADFINKIVREVPPKFTHTQVGEAYHPSRSWEVIATDGGQTEILSRHKSRRAADRAARDTHMPGHRIEVVPSGTVPRVGETRKRSRYEALGSRSREAESVEKSASELEYAIGAVPGAVTEARRKLRGSWSRDAKDVIIPVFNELKRAVEHGRIVQNTSARSLLQLPVYGDQTHPFTEARNMALSHEALLKEAERLKSTLSRATVGDAEQVRAALDAVEGVGEPSGARPRTREARRSRKTHWAIGETVYTISRIPGHPVDIPTGAKVTIEEIQKPRSKRHKDSFGKWQTTRYEERIRVSYHGHDYWVNASDLAHHVSF